MLPLKKLLKIWLERFKKEIITQTKEVAYRPKFHIHKNDIGVRDPLFAKNRSRLY